MDSPPRLFPVPDRTPGPVERAVVDGDDLEAINRVLEKCARTLDECDSARDIKALSITVIDGIARRRELGGGREPQARERPPIEVVTDERRRRVGA